MARIVALGKEQEQQSGRREISHAGFRDYVISRISQLKSTPSSNVKIAKLRQQVQGHTPRRASQDMLEQTPSYEASCLCKSSAVAAVFGPILD